MSIDRFDYTVYGYVSECCGAEIVHHDICSDCGEHCDAVPEDEEDENEGGTGHGDISWSDADPGL